MDSFYSRSYSSLFDHTISCVSVSVIVDVFCPHIVPLLPRPALFDIPQRAHATFSKRLRITPKPHLITSESCSAAHARYFIVPSAIFLTSS